MDGEFITHLDPKVESRIGVIFADAELDPSEWRVAVKADGSVWAVMRNKEETAQRIGQLAECLRPYFPSTVLARFIQKSRRKMKVGVYAYIFVYPMWGMRSDVESWRVQLVEAFISADDGEHVEI